MVPTLGMARVHVPVTHTGNDYVNSDRNMSYVVDDRDRHLKVGLKPH